MRRVIPAALVLALAGCGWWPATSPVSGQLVVQNPLYGRFQTQVVPDSAKRLAILVTSLSDDRRPTVSLITLDAKERQAVVSGVARLPSGFWPVVVRLTAL